MATRIGDPAGAERFARSRLSQWFTGYRDLASGNPDAPSYQDAVRRVIHAQAAYEEVTQQAELPMRAVTAPELLSLVDIDIAAVDRDLAAAAETAGRIAEQLEWLPGVQAIVHGPNLSGAVINHLVLVPSGGLVVQVLSASGQLATRTVDGEPVLLAGDAQIADLESLIEATKQAHQLLDIPTRAILVVNGATGGPLPVGPVTVCTPDELDEVALDGSTSSALDPDAASRVANALGSGAQTPLVPHSIGAERWQRVVCAATAAGVLDSMQQVFNFIRHALATTSLHPDAAAAASAASDARGMFSQTVLQTLGAATAEASFAHPDPLSRWAASVVDGPAGHALRRSDDEAVAHLIDALSAMAAAPTVPPVLKELDRGFGGDLLSAIRVRGTTAAVAQLVTAHESAKQTREQIVGQLQDAIASGARLHPDDIDKLQHHVTAAAHAVDASHARWRRLQMTDDAQPHAG